MHKTMLPLVLCATVLTVFLLPRWSIAQTTRPATTQPAAVTTADPTQAIAQMREELIDAFNKGDLDRLLSHLDPDVVITWQNGEVCRGPEAVRAYYNKMMTGPDRRVDKASADPKVDDRHVYGDWAVSWGRMNDHFVLTDGAQLAMDSRFTATIAKRGDVWKVASFHASVNAFDNPILGMAARKAGSWALMIGILAGVVIGLVVGIMIGRRRAPKPATTA
jgi:uncharacterized protein (TIGR02246 family)